MWPKDAKGSGGSGGVRTGSTTRSGCFMTTAYVVNWPEGQPPTRICLITIDMKHTGKPSAENLHAGFDAAGLEANLRFG